MVVPTPNSLSHEAVTTSRDLTADRHTFVRQRRDRDAPPVTHGAQTVGVRDPDVG